MSSSEATFLKQVLRAHDASGELLAARLRVLAAVAAVLLMVAGANTNTPGSNLVLASSVAVYLTFAVVWSAWFSGRVKPHDSPPESHGAGAQAYASWMSYLSVTIDLTFCHSLSIACLYNHSGVYEMYRNPALWLVVAAANALTALRGNPRVCWFSAGLTVVYGSALLGFVSRTTPVSWVTDATYLGEGLNLFEVFQAQLFAVVPALIASTISHRASKLAIDAAQRERVREDERAQLEWRLKVADRMVTVGTMAAGVAHEVNNPLTYVMHNLEAASRRVASEQDLTDLRLYLERASSGTQRVHQIVAALRTFSRIDEGPRQPVDVRSTIDAALTMASSELKHRAKVDVEQPEQVLVLGNEAKLGQVFLNLIVNAAQALPEPDPRTQRIRISVRREAGRAVIEVTDTGTGIAAEHRSRIFDPFFTTKPVGTGTGLGLSICHSIVTELSGTIDVDSELGKGTTFRVSLPATDDPLPRSSSIQPVAPHHVGRVLVVDDDHLVSETVELMLAEDHDIVLAHGAEDALRMIRQGELFDAIVCDLMMPGMTGIELYFELQSLSPSLAHRMLFATGGAFTPGAQGFVQRMGSRVISKPFRSDELRGKVHKLVASSLAIPQSTHLHVRDGSAHQ